MITLQNDPKANIAELLKTPEVETLFMQMFSVLHRENLDLFGKTVRLSDDYMVTILIEPMQHFYGEHGAYRMFSASPDVEFKITEKK
ncbi:MAG TPA: hypothetical protein VFC02_14655 [Anaerolineales bacterium]|jgi:hypothetical protein|nr:hypothetical protein [Anaerolineales bacterium]